ncbi:hypothetical protein Trydic_g15181 [Trypoxylus dichotomus]
MAIGASKSHIIMVDFMSPSDQGEVKRLISRPKKREGWLLLGQHPVMVYKRITKNANQEVKGILKDLVVRKALLDKVMRRHFALTRHSNDTNCYLSIKEQEYWQGMHP